MLVLINMVEGHGVGPVSRLIVSKAGDDAVSVSCIEEGDRTGVSVLMSRSQALVLRRQIAETLGVKLAGEAALDAGPVN